MKIENIKSKIKEQKTSLTFFFVILFLLSFWYGMDLLENQMKDFFLWKIESSQEPKTVKVFRPSENLNPVRNWEIEDLINGSRAAASIEINNNSKKFLFSENVRERLPIASITKLMTSLIVLEHYNLSEIVEISEKAASQPGSNGQLEEGDLFTVGDLLKIMLIESANDAAFALSQEKEETVFIDLMNSKAREMGLENTYFGNPSGLDPDFSAVNSGIINYSNIEDLINLTFYITKNYPQIWEILLFDEIDMYTVEGEFHHTLKNTNILLNEIDIIGGKTGSTPRAGGCLLLILENPHNEGFLIKIILGSNDRFKEMEEMINWVNSAYKWY